MTYLDRLAEGCGFKRLADLNREALGGVPNRKRANKGPQDDHRQTESQRIPLADRFDLPS